MQACLTDYYSQELSLSASCSICCNHSSSFTRRKAEPWRRSALPWPFMWPLPTGVDGLPLVAACASVHDDKQQA